MHWCFNTHEKTQKRKVGESLLRLPSHRSVIPGIGGMTSLRAIIPYIRGL